MILLLKILSHQNQNILLLPAITWLHFQMIIVSMMDEVHRLPNIVWSLHEFHVIMSLNIITEQKGKGQQVIRTIKTFDYENTRSDFKCCDYWEKWEAISTTNIKARYTRNLRNIFRKSYLRYWRFYWWTSIWKCCSSCKK